MVDFYHMQKREFNTIFQTFKQQFLLKIACRLPLALNSHNRESYRFQLYLSCSGQVCTVLILCINKIHVFSQSLCIAHKQEYGYVLYASSSHQLMIHFYDNCHHHIYFQIHMQCAFECLFLLPFLLCSHEGISP